MFRPQAAAAGTPTPNTEGDLRSFRQGVHADVCAVSLCARGCGTGARAAHPYAPRENLPREIGARGNSGGRAGEGTETEGQEREGGAKGGRTPRAAKPHARQRENRQDHHPGGAEKRVPNGTQDKPATAKKAPNGAQKGARENRKSPAASTRWGTHPRLATRRLIAHWH